MRQTEKFDLIEFVRTLAAISERQFGNETKAAVLIERALSERGVSFAVQRFTTTVPRTRYCALTVDSKRMSARATGLKSGTIASKNALISSLISSQKNIADANINFNPHCRSISRSNHYFSPAVAVAARDVSKIIAAKKIRARIKIVPTRHQSENILVGNLVDPAHVLFCHYDSFGPGALDNASGTALLLKFIIDFPDLSANCLFVIAGNEELSYDFPVYWGHGYRVFEKKYESLLARCRDIFAVDCVGNGKPVLDNHSRIVKLSFPIKNLMCWSKKIYAVYGDEEKLMAVYHSDLDVPSLVRPKYMDETLKKLLRFII